MHTLPLPFSMKTLIVDATLPPRTSEVMSKVITVTNPDFYSHDMLVEELACITIELNEGRENGFDDVSLSSGAAAFLNGYTNKLDDRDIDIILDELHAEGYELTHDNHMFHSVQNGTPSSFVALC